MKGVSVLVKVHCHICPLKEACSFSETASSYRLQKFFRAELNEENLSDDDWANVRRATLNCPLRKLLEGIKNEAVC